MTLTSDIDYKVTHKGHETARKICAKIDDQKTRKRAFKALLCLDALADYLFLHGIEVDISKNLYKIFPLNKEFEFTDLHCNGRFIDILPVANDNYVLIPKKHSMFGVVPDLYVVADYNQITRNVKFLGCIAGDKVDKTRQIDGYFVMETNNLLPPTTLEDMLQNPKATHLSNENHSEIASYFIDYLDGDLSDDNKKQLITHLIECKACRSLLTEYFDYETIVKQTKKFPHVFDDSTLDIVGAAAVNDEKYKDFEEVTVEIDKEPDEYEEDEERTIRPAIEDPLQMLYKNNNKDVFDILGETGKVASKSIIDTILTEQPAKLDEPQKEEKVKKPTGNINPKYYEEDLSDGLDGENHTTIITDHEEELEQKIKNEVLQEVQEEIKQDVKEEVEKEIKLEKEQDETPQFKNELDGINTQKMSATDESLLLGDESQTIDKPDFASEDDEDRIEILDDSDDLLLLDEPEKEDEFPQLQTPEPKNELPTAMDGVVYIDQDETQEEENKEKEINLLDQSAQEETQEEATHETTEVEEQPVITFDEAEELSEDDLVHFDAVDIDIINEEDEYKETEPAPIPKNLAAEGLAASSLLDYEEDEEIKPLPAAKDDEIINVSEEDISNINVTPLGASVAVNPLDILDTPEEEHKHQDKEEDKNSSEDLDYDNLLISEEDSKPQGNAQSFDIGENDNLFDFDHLDEEKTQPENNNIEDEDDNLLVLNNEEEKAPISPIEDNTEDEDDDLIIIDDDEDFDNSSLFTNTKAEPKQEETTNDDMIIIDDEEPTVQNDSSNDDMLIINDEDDNNQEISTQEENQDDLLILDDEEENTSGIQEQHIDDSLVLDSQEQEIHNEPIHQEETDGILSLEEDDGLPSLGDIEPIGQLEDLPTEHEILIDEPAEVVDDEIKPIETPQEQYSDDELLYYDGDEIKSEETPHEEPIVQNQNAEIDYDLSIPDIEEDTQSTDDQEFVRPQGAIMSDEEDEDDELIILDDDNNEMPDFAPKAPTQTEEPTVNLAEEEDEDLIFIDDDGNESQDFVRPASVQDAEEDFARPAGVTHSMMQEPEEAPTMPEIEEPQEELQAEPQNNEDDIFDIPEENKEENISFEQEEYNDEQVSEQEGFVNEPEYDEQEYENFEEPQEEIQQYTAPQNTSYEQEEEYEDDEEYEDEEYEDDEEDDEEEEPKQGLFSRAFSGITSLLKKKSDDEEEDDEEDDDEDEDEYEDDEEESVNAQNQPYRHRPYTKIQKQYDDLQRQYAQQQQQNEPVQENYIPQNQQEQYQEDEYVNEQNNEYDNQVQYDDQSQYSEEQPQYAETPQEYSETPSMPEYSAPQETQASADDGDNIYGDDEEYEDDVDDEDEYDDEEEDDEDETSEDEKKKSLIKKAVIAIVAVVLLAGIGFGAKAIMSGNSQQEVAEQPAEDMMGGDMEPTGGIVVPDDNNMENTESQPPMETENPDNGGMGEEEPAPPISSIQPNPATPKAGTPNATTEDMNKAVANAFSDTPSAVSVRKTSWGVSATLAGNPEFKQYLQSTGKHIQSAVQSSVCSLKGVHVTGNTRVQMIIAHDGTLQDATITKSSGSSEVDSTVLQSIKQTMKTAIVPSSAIQSVEQQTGSKTIKMSLTVTF